MLLHLQGSVTLAIGITLVSEIFINNCRILFINFIYLGLKITNCFSGIFGKAICSAITLYLFTDMTFGVFMITS